MGFRDRNRGRHEQAHLPPANVHRPVGTIRSSPEGAPDISQVQASWRARRLEPNAKQRAPQRGVGQRVTKDTDHRIQRRCVSTIHDTPLGTFDVDDVLPAV